MCWRQYRTPNFLLCAGSMRREDLGVPEGPGSQCMTACSRDGSVVEIAPLSEKDWYVLATVQSALQQERITAPLSWVEHDRFRHGDGRNKQGEGIHANIVSMTHQAAKHTSQFLLLPTRALMVWQEAL